MASPLNAVGDTLPLLTVLLHSDGAAPALYGPPVNLTGVSGSALTLNIYNTGTKTNAVGAGTWAILNTTNGIAQYTWASADVATAGNYLLYVTLTLAGGMMTFDPIPMTLVTK